jgi:hypothetical protein
MTKKREPQNLPLNVKEGVIVKALDNCLLHLNHCCCPPILFDEVQFTVIFGVKIAQMTTRLNQLLKLGLLRHKIWL